MKSTTESTAPQNTEASRINGTDPQRDITARSYHKVEGDDEEVIGDDHHQATRGRTSKRD